MLYLMKELEIMTIIYKQLHQFDLSFRSTQEIKVNNIMNQLWNVELGKFNMILA